MPLHAVTVQVDDLDQLGIVVAEMEQIRQAGSGWINVRPEVPLNRQPPRGSLLTQVIRRNSPDVALGTWTPGSGNEPSQIGLQHHLGVRILPELPRLGLERPEGWRRVQDSPRRGLVLAIGDAARDDVVAHWLLELVAATSTIETSGRWIVEIHHGRSH